MTWLEHPAVKWAVPLPLLAALAPVVWLFFRGVWRAMDDEALERRLALRQAGQTDWRPMAAVLIGIVILTLQEYFGRPFFETAVRPPLNRWMASHPTAAAAAAPWSEFLSHAWWGFTRIGGYLIPFAVWRFLFPQDRLRDFGLRGQGLGRHLWIYALCLAVVVPVLLVVRRQPDFGAYYPFYRLAGRSWLDFAIWEAVYLAQFLALELFFRGWWVHSMRSLGAASVFLAAAPYCMIHYGKPYLEAMGALVAGVVLGSLAVKTRSIWAGFLAHATVALLMDVLALEQRRSLPVLLAPGSARRFAFPYWGVLWWFAWATSLGVLLLHLRRSWPVVSERLRARGR